MMNSPGMQSLIRQMAENPQLMQNMFQAPYMQSMLQMMAANPQMAEQVRCAGHSRTVAGQTTEQSALCSEHRPTATLSVADHGRKSTSSWR